MELDISQNVCMPSTSFLNNNPPLECQNYSQGQGSLLIEAEILSMENIPFTEPWPLSVTLASDFHSRELRDPLI